MTVVVERYTFPQLARFNKEPGEDYKEPDPDDELKDLNPKYLPHWNPPLTEHKCKVARKDIKRRGHILGSLIHVKRFVWRHSELQIKLMFDFFSSARAIQNVAFGTIRGKDHEAQYIYIRTVRS